MYRFYLAAVDLIPASVILAPVFLLLNRLYFHNTGKSLLFYLFSCYLAVVYVLVGLPNVTYLRPEWNLNLIPFSGIIADWKNSILNILLFVPLGLMLPILWRGFKQAVKTVRFGFGMSLAIELLQGFTFRATDVNDLITNTCGAYLGFLCARILQKKFSNLDLVAQNQTYEIWIIVSAVVVAMFFIYPFISAALWNFILA